MEQVQRKVTKLVEGFRKFDYDTRLKKLGFTTLEKRRIRGVLIETFKILTDREKISKQDLFDVRQRNYYLCGHSYSIEVKRSRINLHSNFFSQRTLKQWNSLPEHVVSASSVNCSRTAWIHVQSGVFKSDSLLSPSTSSIKYIYLTTVGSVALLVARRTDDGKVASSRPTKVVCTVLTGNRMGVNCPLWPAATPSSEL